MRCRSPLALLACGLVLLPAVLVGCGTAPAVSAPAQGSAPATSSAPPPSPSAGSGDWVQATIDQPSAVTAAASVRPGQFCSPCHPAAASQLFGVAVSPSGLVAVGVQQPPAIAIAFTSTDGRTWRPVAGFAAEEGTAALAVASAGGRTVIVGTRATDAAAWVSTRDGTWERVGEADLTGAAGQAAMTSVVPLGGAWVAGGYADDPARALAAAAIWRSDDGLVWRRVDGRVLRPGRIWGVAARGETVVAVGTAGDSTYGPAAAWRSTDAGATWRRATIAGAGDGAMRGVAATAWGFVAVGANGADDGASVWTSTDGAGWTRVAAQSALTSGDGPLRMLSVATGSGGLVAGGWRADAANGSAVVWRSVDGRSWVQDPWLPTFSGGQIASLVVDGSGAIAVGRTGYPDNNQATAWLAPPP